MGTVKPLSGRTARCRDCGGQVVFARTLAGPNGPGGRPMPLDVFPNPDGNVAVRETGPGRLVCRVLGKDDAVDETVEQRAMPHFASCRKVGDQAEEWLRSVTEAGEAGQPPN